MARRIFTARGYAVDLQEVEPGRFQTIATLRGTGGGMRLMFNGNIDIDPLAYGWKRDPWTPTVEGDFLCGAGVYNMKAGVASMIAAAEALRKSGAARRGDLIVACVAGELQGGVGTVHVASGDSPAFSTDRRVSRARVPSRTPVPSSARWCSRRRCSRSRRSMCAIGRWREGRGDPIRHARHRSRSGRGV